MRFSVVVLSRRLATPTPSKGTYGLRATVVAFLVLLLLLLVLDWFQGLLSGVPHGVCVTWAH